MKGRKREKKERVRVGMPDAFALREGAYIARGTVAEEGVPLLVYQIALPAFAKESAARLGDFYAHLASELLRELEGRLFPFVRRAYAACDDPHKRYRFARYMLTVDFALVREGGVLTVSRRAYLSRRGKVLREGTWCERFFEGSGRAFLGRFSRLGARVKPKKKLWEALRAVASRYTERPFQEKDASSVASDGAPPSPAGEGKH